MRRRGGRGLLAVGAMAALAATGLPASHATTTVAPTASTTAAPVMVPRPVLRYGMSDPAVAELQHRLGMSLVTGYFGPITLGYVTRLQVNAGLAVNGVVGRRTWRAVNRRRIAPAPPIPSSTGQTSAVLGIHPGIGAVAAPMTRFRDGGHAYYRYNGRLHSCRYRGRCVDMNGPAGADVFAMADGILRTQPYAAHSFGNFVTITHRDGTESVYAHLASVAVSSGRVRAGARIGTVGCSGTSGEANGCRSSLPHLHFEWSGLRWNPGEPGEPPPFFDKWRGSPPRCYQGC